MDEEKNLELQKFDRETDYKDFYGGINENSDKIMDFAAEVKEALADKQPLLTAGANVSISENNTIDMIGSVPAGGATNQVLAKIDAIDYNMHWVDQTGGGGGTSTFDVVIRTQAEFEALYGSPTWLGATSVAFIGDGGTLTFTSTTGLTIPLTVKQIIGFNAAKLSVTAGGSTTYAIGYASLPTASSYLISEIDLSFNSGYGLYYGFRNCPRITGCSVTNVKISGHPFYGFYSCTNLVNCTAKIGSASDLYASGVAYGFYSCTNLVNCNGEGAATSGINSTQSTAYGFYSCTNLVNCNGTASASGATNAKTLNAYAFGSCSNLTNCKGIGLASGIATSKSGYGFNSCKQLANCIGSGTGLVGYAFIKIDHAVNCKNDTTASTTAIWGGANTYIDNDSCQLDEEA